MKLYNTKTRSIEEFKPINSSNVSLYTCGPTVYDYTHIGHMRAYVINDLLRRSLSFCGYKVKHVMNITDVGHLTGDDDTGEDKLEKGAKKSKKTVWDVVKFFTEYFFKTTDSLNILRPDIVCAATDHIKEMITLIEKLKDKGFTYETEEAIYYDVSKFVNYGKLSGQSLEDKLKGARQDVYIDPKKKNNADFALWFKRVGRFADHSMHWESPWGDGFPGWHIECSAMSMKYLGESIDIHTGGVDHIPVHHENEIAQSEGATGKEFVRYWLHYNFLMVDNQKMSKSLGNFYTLDDLIKHNISPLSLRYLFLQSHYRQLTNFTWKAVEGAEESYNRLKNIVFELKKSSSTSNTKNTEEFNSYLNKFKEAVSNDLQTPQSLAIMWEVIKSKLEDHEKLKLILDFDKVFGLKLDNVSEEKIPEEVIKLAEERKEAKINKDFEKSDELRKKINSKGFNIEDLEDNRYKIKKI